MNPLEGLIPDMTKVVLPWWLKPLLLAIALAVFGAWAYSRGVDTERAVWQAAENTKLIAQQERILELQNEKYDLEQKRVADIANRTAQLKQEMKQNEDKANAVIAAVRADNLRLRVKAVRPATSDGAAAQACAAAPGAYRTGEAGLSGGSGEFSVELAPGYSEYFIGRASKCDQLALKFNKAIEQLAADRGQAVNKLPDLTTTGETP